VVRDPLQADRGAGALHQTILPGATRQSESVFRRVGCWLGVRAVAVTAVSPLDQHLAMVIGRVCRTPCGKVCL